MQGIASDRDLNKTQYEKLTKELECNTNTLQSKIEQLETNQTAIAEQYAASIKEKSDNEIKLEDIGRQLAETREENANTIAVLNTELKDSKDLIASIEEQKQTLHEEINSLTKEMKKIKTSANSEAEITELKKKLNLTLSNAKRLETEVRLILFQLFVLIFIFT